jgi:manganese/zinc/iron transport system permease protein
MINPYFNQDLFGFIKTFLIRLATLFPGSLATDEVQIFALTGIAIASALSGTFLVLKKMTMQANSLSHTLLLGIVGAFLLFGGDKDGLYLGVGPLLAAAFVMGLVTVALTHFLTHVIKLQEDAALGMVFTSLFALGIIAVTLLTRSAHIGIEVVMGNVDALHVNDLKLVFWVLLFNTATLFLFYKEFVVASFDPILAKTIGISVPFYSALLMTETSFALIGSFRSTGVLMVLAFLVIPPLTARFYTYRLAPMLMIAAAIGAGLSFLGVALSRHLLSVQGTPVSTAGLIVLLLVLFFGISYAIAFFRKRTATV